MDTVTGWYFSEESRRLRYGDGRPIALGVTHEVGRERLDGTLRGIEQQPNLSIPVAVTLRATTRASSFDFFESMLQRCDQLLAALRIIEKIVLEVRITLHRPDVAQHFVQHPRRTTGATLGA